MKTRILIAVVVLLVFVVLAFGLGTAEAKPIDYEMGQPPTWDTGYPAPVVPTYTWDTGYPAPQPEIAVTSAPSTNPLIDRPNQKPADNPGKHNGKNQKK